MQIIQRSLAVNLRELQAITYCDSDACHTESAKRQMLDQVNFSYLIS